MYAPTMLEIGKVVLFHQKGANLWRRRTDSLSHFNTNTVVPDENQTTFENVQFDTVEQKDLSYG